MEELKKWMVGLDFSDFDDHLIGYTHYLSGLLSPQEIVFMHVKKRIDIPERFLKRKISDREDLQKQMQEKVKSLFGEDTRVKCEVYEGTPSFEAWRETYLHRSDLFIAGEKKMEFGRKIMPEKFVRQSFCSVLLVPMEAKEIRNIWVPVDYSENSMNGVRVASRFASHSPDIKVHVHYLYDTPNLNLIAEELKGEYLQYHQKEAEEGMEKFIGTTPHEKHIERWQDKSLAHHIRESAARHNADLIIASSRGQSRVTGILLGSTTLDLVSLEMGVPLLILKERVDKVRAWDVLTNLVSG